MNCRQCGMQSSSQQSSSNLPSIMAAWMLQGCRAGCGTVKVGLIKEIHWSNLGCHKSQCKLSLRVKSTLGCWLTSLAVLSPLSAAEGKDWTRISRLPTLQRGSQAFLLSRVCCWTFNALRCSRIPAEDSGLVEWLYTFRIMRHTWGQSRA